MPSGRSVASASRSRPVLPVEPGHCGGSNLPRIPTTPASSARGGVRKGYPLGIVQSDLRRSLLRGVHPSSCGFILAVLARAGRKAAGFGRNPPFLPTGRHLPPTDRLLVAAVRGFASSSAPSDGLGHPGEPAAIRLQSCHRSRLVPGSGLVAVDPRLAGEKGTKFPSPSRATHT